MFVSRIDGNFFTICGLPINKVYNALKKYGIYPSYTDREYI
ncbi:MAG: Maf family protein [Clostridiales bacterium]|nr:Maf family protein [Clostridiales bacterium]